MTALDDVPVGEVWRLEELLRLRGLIEAEGGLEWSIVEVLPVHEAIKSGRTADLRQKCALLLLRNFRVTILDGYNLPLTRIWNFLSTHLGSRQLQ